MTYRFIIAACVAGLFSGCTFQSSQLNTVRALFDRPPKSDFEWVARYGARTQPVIAVNQEPFIVFANNQETAIAFDGWRIRSIAGFGLKSPIKIAYRQDDPIFQVGGKTRRHRCSEWRFSKMPTGGEWHQTCEADFYYQNSVALDTEGRIIRISQVIDATGTRLLLEKTQVD